MHTSAKLAVIVIEERGKSPHVLVVPMWAPLYLIIIMDQRTDYTTLQSKASRIETLYDLDLMVISLEDVYRGDKKLATPLVHW